MSSKFSKKTTHFFKALLVFVLLVGFSPVHAAEDSIEVKQAQPLIFSIQTGTLILSNFIGKPIHITASLLNQDGEETGQVFELPSDISAESNVILPLREGQYRNAVAIEIQPEESGLMGLFVDENGTIAKAQSLEFKEFSKRAVKKAVQKISTKQLVVNDEIISYSQPAYYDAGYSPGECKQFVRILVNEAGGTKNMVRSSGDTKYSNIQTGMIVQSSLPHTFIALSDYDSSRGVLALDSNWVGHYKVGVHWFSPKQLEKYRFKGYWAGSRAISDNIRQISSTLKFNNAFTVTR